ncbi:hypothetical protein AgCh_016892 [Apium graveolens]
MYGLNDPCVFILKDSMAPRWKGKDATAKALADPISRIISAIVTAEKDKQWFQLNMEEEAFFLCDSLKCLKILG